MHTYHPSKGEGEVRGSGLQGDPWLLASSRSTLDTGDHVSKAKNEVLSPHGNEMVPGKTGKTASTSFFQGWEQTHTAFWQLQQENESPG